MLILGSTVPWIKSQELNAKIAQTQLTASRQSGREVQEGGAGGGGGTGFASGRQVCLFV